MGRADLGRRLRALERVRRETPKGLRLVVCALVGTLDLATSTCVRHAGRNGGLVEVIRLSGPRSDISDDALERWIASFPIEDVGEGKLQR